MGNLSPAQAFSLYSDANPYTSRAAYEHSNYSLFHDGTLVRLLDWREPPAKAKLAHHAMRAFITSAPFPCVGAKAAVRSGGYRFGYYAAMNDADAEEGLARDLCAFAAEFRYIRAKYRTFIAVFGDEYDGEPSFETALWSLLQQLHERDRQHCSWDPAASSDPADPSFSFSFAGMAFFVVGLHPRSSRRARRFSRPALAFNAREQFEELRRSGHFARLQRDVRAREIALQGSLNPNLAEFGEASEAREYSGRAVEADWRCPFHPS